jgi:hypothetical protein
MRRLRHPDLVATVVLVALWLFFFWRLFTPFEGDQASLKRGDFSGQFVAFAGYQYARLTQGEVPLWNPYNNGGLPFIADTQAAVFYPPRLATIALAYRSGGWSYHPLELEMTAHVLIYTLMLYAFVRRLTLGWSGSVLGAVVAAVVGGYGGYLSGYPPLQLALLEAGIWLPLAALGILEATRTTRLCWTWLFVTGLALGLSWMAGHPQTSYFLTLLLAAYFAYNVYARRWSWRVFFTGTALFGVIAFGLAAVQLLPGFEYLTHTARVDLTYDAKGNGFPFQDLAQFVFPGIVSLFSPLYVGFAALALAFFASWRRLPQSRFWGVAALLALLWSLGANSPLYPLFYNLLPGLRFFRGQERAAYLVANSLAILAGLGAAHIASAAVPAQMEVRRFRFVLSRVFVAVLALMLLVFAAWLGSPDDYGQIIGKVAFGTLMVGLTALLLPWLANTPKPTFVFVLLPLLILFELFTVNMDADSNYDPVPPSQQLSLTPPPLVAQALADADAPFRVDGFRGLTDNYGSLYRLADIHGISPLFLQGPFTLIEGDMPDPVAWELFAVRYVFTDWGELPAPSEIIGTGTDRWGGINLHRLENPRPFAGIHYRYVVVSSDEETFSLLRDPNFPIRATLILNRDPGTRSDNFMPSGTQVLSIDASPEQITIVAAPSGANGILSIALPYYPGWYAAIDGQSTDILKAYGALSAVVLPEGEHTVQLTFNPLSYRIGAVLSLVAWIGCGILGIVLIFRTRNTHVRQQPTSGLDRPA